MTIDRIRLDLARLLPSFDDGKWHDASYHNVRSGPILRLCRNPSNTLSGPVFESKMDEHDMTVDEVLRVFARRLPGVKTLREWRGN